MQKKLSGYEIFFISAYLIYYVKKNDKQNIRIYLDMIVNDFMDAPLLLLGVAHTFSENSFQNKYYETIAQYLTKYI